MDAATALRPWPRSHRPRVARRGKSIGSSGVGDITSGSYPGTERAEWTTDSPEMVAVEVRDRAPETGAAVTNQAAAPKQAGAMVIAEATTAYAPALVVEQEDDNPELLLIFPPKASFRVTARIRSVRPGKIFLPDED